MSVIVFGSVNMDLVARSPRLPVPGETLIGEDFATVPGGKGANQAVAVARLGVPTQMVGRVGNDTFGRELLSSLRTEGVGCAFRVDPSTHSGVAIITVDAEGENHIVIIPGANGEMDETDLGRLQSLLPSAKVLLLQLEIPIESVLAAARSAREAGVTVILDPAPGRTNLPAELYSLVDVLTPNQVEAGQLVGFPISDAEMAAEAGEILRQRGANTVIVKLGRRGALYVSTDGTFLVHAFPVTAVDTVAAGDAFNGGMAAAIAEGLSLSQAVVWGAAAGAIAVTKQGAQVAMPTRKELEKLLSSH